MNDDLIDQKASARLLDEFDAVREMFGVDFSELAILYRSGSQPRLKALRDAGAAGDRIRIAKIAHALGGSSASIGAIALAALCKELEVLAMAGALGGFEQRLAAIEAEFHRAHSKLQEMLQ
jgi:HPt (histidine-containing phosphotransfer) domain-containing protein